MKEITEKMLAELRERVRSEMSEARFAHTLAVEEMTVRLCALFCPEHTQKMRAAAILHDLTKEVRPAGQIALCEELGLAVSNFDRSSPKTFHARTAAARIVRDFEEFDDPMIVNAVRRHTTGCAEMGLTDELLYLADYIDESRTYEFCVALRRMFWDAKPEKMDEEERMNHLRTILLRSFDVTISDLISEGKTVAIDTLMARNALLLQQMRISN